MAREDSLPMIPFLLDGATAYGDRALPPLDAEQLHREIAQFVDAVAALIGR